jgi:negative regulator of sigma-B (phosphoserine phosphatase)
MDALMTPAVKRAKAPMLRTGIAMRTRQGQAVSGDLSCVVPLASQTLVAAVDGEGHGPEAARAASVVVDVLRAYSGEELGLLVRRCHRALQNCRGAVMSVAVFDAALGVVTWLGVGNIEGVLLRAGRQVRPSRRSLLLRPGMLGYSLPELQAEALPLGPGDTLILATDGIRGEFLGDLSAIEEPQAQADRLSARYSKQGDDSLVVVARYQPPPAEKAAGSCPGAKTSSDSRQQ